MHSVTDRRTDGETDYSITQIRPIADPIFSLILPFNAFIAIFKVR